MTPGASDKTRKIRVQFRFHTGFSCVSLKAERKNLPIRLLTALSLTFRRVRHSTWSLRNPCETGVLPFAAKNTLLLLSLFFTIFYVYCHTLELRICAVSPASSVVNTHYVDVLPSKVSIRIQFHFHVSSECTSCLHFYQLVACRPRSGTAVSVETLCCDLGVLLVRSCPRVQLTVFFLTEQATDRDEGRLAIALSLSALSWVGVHTVTDTT